MYLYHKRLEMFFNANVRRWHPDSPNSVGNEHPVGLLVAILEDDIIYRWVASMIIPAAFAPPSYNRAAFGAVRNACHYYGQQARCRLVLMGGSMAR